MYIVEIESEQRPGTWFQVDEPHELRGKAIMEAFRLGVLFPNVTQHLRVRRNGSVILAA